MKAVPISRNGLVWGVLLTATALNWALMEMGVLGGGISTRLIDAAILIVAFFKARLVIRHFMEVAEAPVMLGLLFDGWVVIVCGSLQFQLLR